MLKDSIYARKVWDGCPWKVVGVDRSWVNPIDWVWLIWDKQGEEGLTRFTAMGWSLWNARNSVVFRESVKIPFVLCRDVERYL
jgi:hypothetical protein